MNLSFTGTRWFLLLIAVFLPLLLLAVAVLLQANICYIMTIITWIGLALIIFYLPKFKD